MDVANSIALVTGANGGLGQYYVEALRSQGAAKIYAGARNPKALEALVADHPDIVIPLPSILQMNSLSIRQPHNVQTGPY